MRSKNQGWVIFSVQSIATESNGSIPCRTLPSVPGRRVLHTMEGTLNAEQPPTAQTRSRNAFSFIQPAAGADFLAFLGINDA